MYSHRPIEWCYPRADLILPVCPFICWNGEVMEAGACPGAGGNSLTIFVIIKSRKQLYIPLEFFL